MSKFRSRRLFLGVTAASLVGTIAPSVAFAQSGPYGEIGQTDARKLSASQDFLLSMLIARLTDRRNASFLANTAYQKGYSYVNQSEQGGDAYHWTVPLAFAFNPSLQWYARSWDNLVISTQWQFAGNRGVDQDALAWLINRINQSPGTDKNLNTGQLLGTWYAMVIAAASVSFSAWLTQKVSAGLAARTFRSVEEAQLAVSKAIENIGDDELNAIYSQYLFIAQADSYVPLQSTGGFTASKTLNEFQTRNNGVFKFVEGKGWEQHKGYLLFSAGEGVIDGVTQKISINSSRDSSFTTKGVGRK